MIAVRAAHAALSSGVSGFLPSVKSWLARSAARLLDKWFGSVRSQMFIDPEPCKMGAL
jgi:hypothetical protein